MGGAEGTEEGWERGDNSTWGAQERCGILSRGTISVCAQAGHVWEACCGQRGQWAQGL